MPKPSKGHVAGFVALGLLVALTAVAFYSSRQIRPVPQSQTGSPNPSLDPSPISSTEGLPDVAGGGAPAPRGKESLPKQHSGGSTITAVAEDIMLTPKARLLAERLVCVCGCNDLLAVCTCTETPGSRDMKKYLQKLVDEGKTPPEIESAMVARYGEAVRP